MTEIEDVLLRALKEIQERGPRDRTCGICANVASTDAALAADASRQALSKPLSEALQETGHDTVYPVDVLLWGTARGRRGDLYDQFRDKWDREHVVFAAANAAKTRWWLLARLIRHLEARL